MKRFISSFHHLHHLDVNQEFGGDSKDEWYTEATSGISSELPPAIRSLEFNINGPTTLGDLLEWLHQRPGTALPIQHFSVQMGTEHHGPLLRSLLRSFGMELTSLNLEYSWPTGLPMIDLSANTCLRSLSITLELANQDADQMKEHFSTIISTLSSQSLQTVRFNVKIRRPACPQDDFMDWGVLDEAAGNAHIWVTIQCSRKKKMKIEGVKEDITRQMPLHRAQGKLECTVSITILYRSVTIYNSKIRVFTRSMEENECLAPLIKHLALDRSNTQTDWLYINRILRVLSPHEALRSFHLPATTRISPKDIEVIQSVSLLSFLGHLDVDINIFPSLHAIKQFIASFPQIHTLDVNDEFGRAVEGEWLDESASDAPIEFPPSIRTLGYHLGARQFLEAFLRPWNDQAPLGLTLRSFGSALRALRLVYSWRAELPSIDLCENTNLHSLMITVEPHDQLAATMKEYLSTVLKSISSTLLEIVEFNLELDSSMSPRYDFMDWGALDQATGSAYIRVSVLCRETSQIAGVEEGIVGQMPQHRGKLSCSVSAAFA
ncbi:hypothetical protein ONZ45_g12609 [Pleurotus djamor]|nr:hypothetical protein ONZ45_g12609 [Pleurotus djamor]